MAKLVIQNLSKNFGKLNVLKNINLNVEEGKLTVILGPSGSGKSTLMRCIVGFESIDEGRILVDDQTINDIHPKERDIAMVFQYYALYPHMSVQQNLSLGLEHTTDLSKDEIRKKVEEISKILKIGELLNRKPSQLSGGQSQRVAIGRALIREPKIFLLDEPLSAIDAKMKRDLRAEIKRIQRDFGITTLYITHDQEEAMAVGDRLAVMKKGEILQTGKPEAVFNKPANLFLAKFIGKPQMNILNMRLLSRGDKHYLKNEDIAFMISKEYSNRIKSATLKENIFVGIRPSALRITGNGDIPNSESIEGTVTVTENLGCTQYLYVLVNDTKVIIKDNSNNIYGNGDTINFTFQEDDIYLFDTDTNLAIKTN